MTRVGIGIGRRRREEDLSYLFLSRLNSVKDGNNDVDDEDGDEELLSTYSAANADADVIKAQEHCQSIFENKMTPALGFSFLSAAAAVAKTTITPPLSSSSADFILLILSKRDVCQYVLLGFPSNVIMFCSINEIEKMLGPALRGFVHS